MKTLITPDIASEILQKNTINRKIVKGNLDFLKMELVNSRFIYNGESIIISKDDTLLDGQHRLLAVAQTGISAYMNLVSGVDGSAMSTIDTGSNRSAGSVFSIHNITHSTSASSMVKKIIERFATTRLSSKNGAVKTSHQQLLNFYLSKEQILSSILAYCSSLYSKNIKILPPSDAAAYMYLFGLENKKAKQFIREVITGKQEGLSNHAVLLREKLIGEKISNSKMTSTAKRNIIIAAFKGYLKDKEILNLRVYGEQSFIKGDINILKSEFNHSDFKQ